MKDELEGGIPAEVDFSGGVRGKYAGKVRHDAVYVPLEADVSDAFPTSRRSKRGSSSPIKTAARTMPQTDRKAS